MEVGIPDLKQRTEAIKSAPVFVEIEDLGSEATLTAYVNKSLHKCDWDSYSHELMLMINILSRDVYVSFKFQTYILNINSILFSFVFVIIF